MTQGLVGQLLAGHQEPCALGQNTATVTSPLSVPDPVLGVLKS